MEKNQIIKGLHSCKPQNEPQVGQIKSFVYIEYLPVPSEGKKAWTKIKNASAEQGGTPFKILKVEPTGFTDKHGNVSFNLEIEPVEPGQQPLSNAQQRGGTEAKMSKDDYWGWKKEFDIAAQARMGRAHSQEMAMAKMT